MKIKKFEQINENYSDELFTFSTKIDKLEVDFDEELLDIENIDYVTPDVTVNWSYELNTSKNGIDSILAHIKNITIALEIETYSETSDDNDMVYKDFTYDVTNADIEILGGDTLPFIPSSLSIVKSSGNPKIEITF